MASADSHSCPRCGGETDEMIGVEVVHEFSVSGELAEGKSTQKATVFCLDCDYTEEFDAEDSCA